LVFHDPVRHIKLLSAWGADPGIVALSYLAGILSGLGYLDQGFAAAQRAFALARVQPHSFSMAWGLQTMAFSYLGRLETAEALQTADALITLSSEQGFEQWRAQGMIVHAGWGYGPCKGDQARASFASVVLRYQSAEPLDVPHRTRR